MCLLDLVTNEFISIVEALAENNDIENNRILIEKDYFRKLLEKYPYMNFKEKVKVYKDLNFIIHDKNNYTLPCRGESKTIRKVVINYSTYTTLKRIIEKEINE